MKRNYKIRIVETLSKEYVINADNQEEALRIVKQNYMNSNDDFVLSADDYVDTEFDIVKEE